MTAPSALRLAQRRAVNADGVAVMPQPAQQRFHLAQKVGVRQKAGGPGLQVAWGDGSFNSFQTPDSTSGSAPREPHGHPPGLGTG
jgi:hypothetical protein